MARIDLTGQKFGRLTVIEYVGKDRTNNTKWRCACDCGKEKVILGKNIRYGKTKSCGCYNREKNTGIKHGQSRTRLYHIWRGMLVRCYNPNDSGYKYYGGRGITMCDEWKNDVNAFSKWAMSNGYRDDLTIDRIDVNGNYEPSNCRWATIKEQENNRRNNHFVTYKGETHTIAEWSEIIGMNHQTLYNRLYYCKGDIEKAFTKPIRRVKKS